MQSRMPWVVVGALSLLLSRLRWLRILDLGICTALAFVLGGQVRASAANVLLLSTGFAGEDTAIQSTLQSLGHAVDIGPQYSTFDGSTLANYDAVLLVPNYNYGVEMSDAGQTALVAFVGAGGGLVTGEWTVWMRGAEGRFMTLYDAVPVVAVTVYRAVGSVTYTADTPDDILDAGVDPAFAFTADSVGGVETNFAPKDGATVFFDSDYQAGAGGVIGWRYGSG